MDKPAGHYSVFRVPFQIDAEGDCTRCGLKIEPDADTLEPHECPPGFTEPAMSGSKGLKRYNGVEQDDEGAYVYYDEHLATLRRAKAEGLDEALKLCAVIENHYATKGKNVQVSDIQRHAVIGVRQSILDRIAELGQHAHTEPPSCLWNYDDIDDCYNTGCGNAYCLVDGTLEENDHKYCPYCGGPIQEDARAAQIEAER